MTQSFPARLPKLGFVLDTRVIVERPKSKFDRRRDVRQTGEISGFYEKKGG